MRRQNKKYFEYRIVITPDVRIGSGERGFTALAPALGIATGGDSVEDALQNIRELIGFHMECLLKEKQPLPGEQSAADFITTTRVAVPR